MSEEKQPLFTVTDRRKFTLDGELRDPSAAEETPAPVPTAETAAAAPEPVPAEPLTELETLPEPFPDDADEDLGPIPTNQETAEQQAAYRQSSEKLDDMIRQANPGIPAAPDVDFEHLVQSVYMAAAVAMGADTPVGQKPRVDIIGARQSIDMLDVLGKKTKGNLTAREEKLLQTALFNLRMMFLEITNNIASQAAKAPGKAPRS